MRERRRDIHVEDWIKVQGIHDHDTPETSLPQPVDGRGRIHHPDFLKESVKRPLHPEHLFDSHGPHEGRQDKRDEDESRERTLQRKAVAVCEQGERKGDQQCHKGAGHPEKKRIPESFKVDRIVKNLDHVSTRETAFLVHEGLADHHHDRKEEEDPEEESHRRCKNNSLPRSHFPSSARRCASR